MAALEHDNGDDLVPNIAQRPAQVTKLKHNALLLFKMDDKDNDGRNALLLFKMDGEADDELYVVMIKNVKRFPTHHQAHVVRQIAAAIGHTCDVMSIGKLSDVNAHLVGQYVRMLVGVALSKIGVMLSSDDVWAFSIACDGSTHRGLWRPQPNLY